MGQSKLRTQSSFFKEIGDDDSLPLEEKQVKKELSDCLKQIAIRTDIASLVRLMNPPSRTTKTSSNEPDRYYAWNFTNLMEGRTGTVEFRRPPSKTKSRDCEPWLWLTVALVDAAVQIDPVQINDDGGTLKRKYPDRTIESFKAFLRTSLDRKKGGGARHTKTRLMCRPILLGKSGKMNVQPMKSCTDAELYAFEEKKDRKKIDIMKQRMVGANREGVEHVVTVPPTRLHRQAEGEVLEDDDEESD